MSLLTKVKFIRLRQKVFSNSVHEAERAVAEGRARKLARPFRSRLGLSKAWVINTQFEYAAAKLLEMVKRTMSAILILAMTSALPAEAQENWICEETAFYSISEDISRTESRKTSTSTILKWIDTNTIGLESISLERVSPNSETFFNQNSGSYLYINRDEEPHVVVLTQPQIWMNKFGNLRVRFYKCAL